jgi:hypothetical protein
VFAFPAYQELAAIVIRLSANSDKDVDCCKGSGGWDGGGSPLLRWWEPPPAPTRVLLDPTASPLPMCDGSGVGFGF